MNSCLRALGFRSHDEELDDLADCPSALPIQPSKPGYEPTDAPVRHVSEENVPQASADTDEVAAQPSDNEAGGDEPTAFPLTIFDSLLDVFNEAQPDFIRKCLDMDAQRRYLYNCVDTSFRDYILRIKDDARREAYRDRDDEHSRMTREIDSLRAQLKENGKTSDDLKALRASADRQKRTFNERIRDLEQQLATAMAEKEQYDLEVKSLMNKLKVQQVQQSDIQELDDLRERLSDANRQITAMNAANAMRESEEAARSKETDSLRERVKELSAQLTEAREEIAKASAAQEKHSLSESDNEQLRNRLAEAEATMKAAEERMVAAESRSRELQSRLEAAEKELHEATARRNEAPSSEVPFDMLELPRAQSDKAASSSGTQDTEPVEKATEPSAPKKRRGRSKKNMPRISAIDESMDSTEWLVATPPEGANLKVAVPSDPDFGYQEPPRKPQPPVNDAQMLLF